MLWFAIIRSTCNRLTLEWVRGRIGTHASLIPIHVSVPPTTSERPSGRRHRECRAPAANRGVSEKAEETCSRSGIHRPHGALITTAQVQPLNLFLGEGRAGDMHSTDFSRGNKQQAQGYLRG